LGMTEPLSSRSGLWAGGRSRRAARCASGGGALVGCHPEFMGRAGLGCSKEQKGEEMFEGGGPGATIVAWPLRESGVSVFGNFPFCGPA